MGNQFLKRIISGITAAAVAVTILPGGYVSAEDITDKYPYTLFAASYGEGAITVNAENFCVNGIIATNGTIETSAQNFNVNGSRLENAEKDMLYIFDKIDAKYFLMGMMNMKMIM